MRRSRAGNIIVFIIVFTLDDYNMAVLNDRQSWNKINESWLFCAASQLLYCTIYERIQTIRKSQSVKYVSAIAVKRYCWTVLRASDPTLVIMTITLNVEKKTTSEDQ